MIEKDTDPWELTPEIIKQIEEHKKRMKEWNRQRVEGLRRLGELLDSEVVGIWGQLGPAGGRMFGVFKTKFDEEFHFIVTGKAEEVAIASTEEEREAICIPLREASRRGDENKVRFVIVRNENTVELKGYVLEKFNPERTPNGHPVKTIEEFLEDK